MAFAHRAHGDDRALVNQWLSYLGNQTGVPLRLDDAGVCTIGHVSGLDCVVEAPGNGSVYLHIGILPWEPESHPDHAERCLIAQFLGRGTDGASFGVDPIDAQLVLWIERPLVSVDEKSFCHHVVTLFATAVRWRGELPAAEEAAERTAAIDADRPAHFSMLKA